MQSSEKGIHDVQGRVDGVLCLPLLLCALPAAVLRNGLKWRQRPAACKSDVTGFATGYPDTQIRNYPPFCVHEHESL